MPDSSTTSARSERVPVYISPETKRELDGEANRQDLSRSELMALYCRRGLRQDREDDLAAETEAARRLGDVIDAGLDDMEDLAHAVEDHNARAGVYAIAVFELLKDEYKPAEVREAIQKGVQRLHADELPDPDAEAADVPETESDRDRSQADDRRGGRSSGGTRSPESGGTRPPSPDELQGSKSGERHNG